MGRRIDTIHYSNMLKYTQRYRSALCLILFLELWLDVWMIYFRRSDKVDPIKFWPCDDIYYTIITHRSDGTPVDVCLGGLSLFFSTKLDNGFWLISVAIVASFVLCAINLYVQHPWIFMIYYPFQSLMDCIFIYSTLVYAGYAELAIICFVWCIIGCLRYTRFVDIVDNQKDIATEITLVGLFYCIKNIQWVGSYPYGVVFFCLYSCLFLWRVDEIGRQVQSERREAIEMTYEATNV